MCEIWEEKIMEILTIPRSLSPPHPHIWPAEIHAFHIHFPCSLQVDETVESDY